MEFIIFCLGAVLGGIVIYLDVEKERNVNQTLKKTINNLETDLDNAIALNKMYQEEHEILITNAMEQRARNKDLENNIELLANNIPEIKKELVSDYHSQN